MSKFLQLILPQTPPHAFWLCFIVCLFVCFGIVFVVAPLTGVSSGFGGDSHDGYIEIARNLVAGKGFVINADGPPVFHRPPMYVFTLLPIAMLPEALQRPALLLVQSIMVGLIAALTFKLARYLFEQKTAAISVLLILLNPWIYWNAKNPMTPILHTLLYILFVISIGSELLLVTGKMQTTLSKTKLWLRRIATGIVAAALALTHGAMLPVSCLLLFALFVLGIARRKPQAAGAAVVIGFVMAALIAPWAYRNWRTFHRFIPTVRGGAMAYFNGVGHWSCTSDAPRRPQETFIDASLRITGFDGTEKTLTHEEGFKDIENDDEMSRKMAADIRARPGVFLIKTALNAVEYYFPMLTYPFLSVKYLSLEQFALTLFHIFLWLFAFAGMFLAKENRTSLSPSILLVVAVLLYAVWYFPFATFIGHSLYTMGTTPVLSILAANGLLRCHSKLIPAKGLNQ